MNNAINDELQFSCSMCYYSCSTNKQLMTHMVHHHSSDPKFKIKCTESGCGCTYKKWKSFRQHLYRKHRVNLQDMISYNSINAEIVCNNDNDNAACSEMRAMWKNIKEKHVLIIYCCISILIYIETNADADIASIDAKEYLIQCAAEFVIHIREECNISVKAMETIIDGITNLVDIYTSILLEQIQKKQHVSNCSIQYEDINSIFKEEYPTSIIFSSVRTKSSLDEFLIEKLNMVPSVNVAVAKSIQWKKRKNLAPKIVKATCNAQVVSVIENLKNLLNNEQVRSSIHGNYHGGQIMRTVLDGSYYQENSVFSKNENALAIIFYYDDLTMTNIVGANAKAHKQSMFYWTLANIHPTVRSSLDVVQLYAVVKTEYLKKSGALAKLLKPFINDIRILQTSGITIDIGGGKTKNYKGSLLFCAGDTPALAVLGGFKESTAAYRLCRSCTATNQTWKSGLCDHQFIPRNMTSHENILNIINDTTISPPAKAFWQKYDGVNNRSPLMDIDHFDITTCLPQDAMHVLIEGPLEIAVRYYLMYCIKSRKLFTIRDLNEKLSAFDFKHLKKDKPALIEPYHLEPSSTLRQSAAQLLALAHTVPFLIGEWIIPFKDTDLEEHISCYTRILQITNLCLAFEVHIILIDILTLMIESFISTFRDLYPNSLVPKFHYLVHIPRYIRLFGPSRQQSCFRFEGNHAYFKYLMPVVRNFKNVALTVAYRHQARLCSKLNSCPGMPNKKFLYQGDTVMPGKSVSLDAHTYRNLFYNFIMESERSNCQMIKTPKIVFYGATLLPKSIVLLESNVDNMPVFGEIDEILIYNDKKLLLISLLETIMYEPKLNAYYIVKSGNNEKIVFNIKDLIFPHDLSSFIILNKTYVPLLYHERTEFYGVTLHTKNNESDTLICVKKFRCVKNILVFKPNVLNDTHIKGLHPLKKYTL
ncbi:uncharacterized protein [Prorops nasuta]|uniref:uncharacterized protein n=1 Tax=Prorops nasuta TaxID=863751 RepID=UPI0034CD78F3